MRRLARVLLSGSLVLVATCAPNLNDLRLESLRPIATVQLPPTRVMQYDPQRFGGVVAEFSSRRDLRNDVACFANSFFAVVERCEGRTHIEDRSDPRQWISSGDFSDELGLLAYAGKSPPDAPGRPTPVEGVPRNGRFHFLLPIHLEAYATDRNIGSVNRRVVEQDLLRAPDDLCVFARGWDYLLGVWRSNTVVIPYDAVRAAIEAAPAP